MYRFAPWRVGRAVGATIGGEFVFNAGDTLTIAVGGTGEHVNWTGGGGSILVLSRLADSLIINLIAGKDLKMDAMKDGCNYSLALLGPNIAAGKKAPQQQTSHSAPTCQHCQRVSTAVMKESFQ